MWFSPPYILKLFNLNPIKSSYSSMPSMKNLIKPSNLKIFSKEQDKIQRSCNCKIKESSPLNGKCLHQFMVHKAGVNINILKQMGMITISNGV